jgi:glycosyltransferase 2 family protein
VRRMAARSGRDQWLVPAATVVALSVLGLVATQPRVPGWERELFAGVNGLADGWWTVPIVAVMQAGTLLAGPLAGAAAFLYGRRRLGVALAGGGVAAWLLARGVKLLVLRPRPTDLLAAVVLRGGESGGLGYPSGHVTIAMALATVLAVHVPGRWRWGLWLLVGLVGFARMYVGMHLPLDLIGGVLLGGLVGMALRRLCATDTR